MLLRRLCLVPTPPCRFRGRFSGWRSRWGVPDARSGSSLFSSPLTLPGVVMTFPVCLPRASALRQVLVAVLAEGALESPSVLVLAFHSSLFLVGGSSDGSAPGDRVLSPGRMCLFHSVSVEGSCFCAVSTGELAFLPPLDLSVYWRIQWRRSLRKLLGFP